MKGTFHLVWIVAAVVCCGCVSTVGQQTLFREVERRDLTTYPTYTFYCGSKYGYDYFAIWHLSSTPSSEKVFRVLESEHTVSSRFPYTQDGRSWRPFAGFDISSK